MRTFVVGSILILLTPIAAGGISREAILLSLSIVTGGLIWKIPPFEIPHKGAFWDLTKERFWELVQFAAKVAAALTLMAVIVSLFYALLARRSVMDTFLTYAAIGAAVGTALGCLGWIVSRVLDDVEILRAEAVKGTLPRPISTRESQYSAALDGRKENPSNAMREERHEYPTSKAIRAEGSASQPAESHATAETPTT